MIRLLVVCLLVLSCGCSSRQNEEIILKINNYSMSAQELMDELNSFSRFERAGKTNEELLNAVIEKKLLLLEAQREGLDKQEPFMKMVERFWEQSLLRAILEKKMSEFSADVKRGDEDGRQKVNKRFEEWLDSVRKRAKVYVNKAAFDKIRFSPRD